MERKTKTQDCSENKRPSQLIQTTINMDRRWIELIDYVTYGEDFQGAH